jgi:hypothetical protein
LPKKNKGRNEQGEERRKESMKHFLTLTVVAVTLLLSISASAVTVSYAANNPNGVRDSSLAFLEAGDLIEIMKEVGTKDVLWAPVDDVVLLTAAIEDGITLPFLQGKGLFQGSQETAGASTGDLLYLRIWNTEEDEQAIGPSAVVLATGTVELSGDSLVTAPIPEPSILIGCLALLLLKRKK